LRCCPVMRDCQPMRLCFLMLSRCELRSTEKVIVPPRYLIMCVFMLSVTAQLSAKRGAVARVVLYFLLSMNCGSVPDGAVVAPFFCFLNAQKCQVATPLSTEKKGCSQRQCISSGGFRRA